MYSHDDDDWPTPIGGPMFSNWSPAPPRGEVVDFGRQHVEPLHVALNFDDVINQVLADLALDERNPLDAATALEIRRVVRKWLSTREGDGFRYSWNWDSRAEWEYLRRALAGQLRELKSFAHSTARSRLRATRMIRPPIAIVDTPIEPNAPSLRSLAA